MKKTILFLLFIAIYGTNSAQKAFTTGIEYNDYIVQQQTDVYTVIDEFNKYVGEMDKPNITITLDKLVAQANTAYTNTKALKGFNGNNALRDAALNLFGFYKSGFNEDYRKMVSILIKDDITPADLDEMDVLLKKITDEETGFDNAFAAAQEAFAKENGFTLK